ncbi:MAG: tetratricopeptide repeat protein [Bacteroidetes bacterium]|nr:tetratricopeptide repeat protein [Bacteroidota bacterium]
MAKENKFYKGSYFSLGFCIFIFAFLLYGNSIRNKYALDDEMVVLNNARVQKGIRGIPAIFTTHHSIDLKSRYEYRPVVLLTFAVEYELFGKNPHISHFINVLIYAFTCLLIFYLLVQLLPGYYIIFPFITVLLFTAHPLHTEAVNNLKSRDELLSLFFSLISLFFILKYVDRGKICFLAAGIISLFIATLSKRGAVIFIALIPLILCFFKQISFKRILVIGSLSCIAYAGFIIFKRTMLSEDPIRTYYYYENPLLFEPDFLKRIPAGLYTIWRYIELLVFPHPLSFYYGFDHVPVAGWNHPKVWISLLFYSALFGIAVKYFQKKHILSFAILFYLFAIFPFSNIPIPAVGIIADRFTYVASLGFCIAVAFLILKLFNVPFQPQTSQIKAGPCLPAGRRPQSGKNSLFILLTTVIIGLYSVKTITRNPDWHDHLTLYRHDIKHLDKSAKAHSLIGNTIYPGLFTIKDGKQKENLINEAIYHYKKALEIYPGYIISNNNLGSIYFTFLGDYKTASHYFSRAVSLDPDYAEAHYNLAYSYEMRGIRDSAIICFEKALNLQPDHKPAYDRIFPLYLSSLQYDKAIEINLQAAANIPEFSAMYYVNAGNVYTAKHDTLNALNYFIKAFEKEPGNRDLCNHIGKVYLKINNTGKAGEYFKKAGEIPHKKKSESF